MQVIMGNITTQLDVHRSKSIIITGGKGTGKTILATQLAKFIGGPYIFVSEQDVKKDKFIFASKPSTVIIEDCKNLDVLYGLTCSETVMCHRKGKEPKEMITPHIICTSELRTMNSSPRFIVIDLGGY